MKETKDECPIEGGYVPIPRNIVKDCRNGLISQPERNLLVWLRMTADKLGVTHCSMSDLADEAFNNQISVSYINKLLRSLKSKRYLWYKDRVGRRGVFEVHHRDWMLKNNKIKRINHLFDLEVNRGEMEAPSSTRSQVSKENIAVSQSIEHRKKAIKTMLSNRYGR